MQVLIPLLIFALGVLTVILSFYCQHQSEIRKYKKLHIKGERKVKKNERKICNKNDYSFDG